jgi:hydroxymethylglutaryl-CoA lyase
MLPNAVRIVEVGPRDGLQNEGTTLDVATRVALIEALADAGLSTIEAGSFVSPEWVPQMAGTGDVLLGLSRRPGIAYPVLVPNAKGYARAREAGAQQIAVFASASETFSQKNLNASIARSLDRYREVITSAVADNVPVRGYVSCALGCPYEGAVPLARVTDVAAALHSAGCREIALSDTVGVGTPTAARRMLVTVARHVPMNALAIHFHDTYGQALANVLACLEEGVSVVDAAVGGLGGCPFARGAAGNLATEDLLYMLDGMEISTGVRMDALLRAGALASRALGRAPASKLARLRGPLSSSR